ncbi:MAG: cadmium-translocating P-type ATPase [Spirochaetales bacterium]|nr:cadmium-translocating P-type ATPase [Spirochaetales bacterium]
MQYELLLENLDCGNCAAYIERKVTDRPDVQNVKLNFVMKKLTLHTENDIIKEEIQKICDELNEGIIVKDFNEDNTADHEESEEHESHNLLWIATAVQVITIVLELIWHFDRNITFLGMTFGIKETILLGLSLFTAIASGYEIFIGGIKNLFRLSFTEDVLMTLAVIPAFCIGEYVEGSMITVLFSIGELIEEYAVSKSRRDIAKIAGIRADTATRLNPDGTEESVNATELRIGDTILVKPYEKIAVDGEIISGQSAVDMSALTGESIPADKGVGDTLLSGSINGSNMLTVRVTKLFGDSTATRILKLVEEAASEKSQGEKLITRFARVYTPIVMIIAVLIAVLPPLFGLGSWSTWLYRSLVALIASCPCAIVIAVPLAYFSSIGAASKTGVLIKGGRYIEALAHADTIVFDKTGTLTTGRMSVKTVKSLSPYYSENDILALAAAAEKYSEHPIAQAIIAQAKEQTPLPEKEYTLTDYSEIAGHGVTAKLGSNTICVGGRNILKSEEETLNDENVFVTLDDMLIGTLTVTDTIRDEAAAVIRSLQKCGVRYTAILTGDNETAAESVRQQLGIDKSYARLLPQDKLSHIKEIKKNAKSVVFVGDGINDAPILTAADCGIAMGLGSDIALESSDAVLSSGTLAQLPTALRIAKRTVMTIISIITFALGVKATVIILGALGLSPLWLAVLADTGLTVLCILWAMTVLKVTHES